jgi:gamma-glutamyltranspeptidase/glutathione hydrolase
VHDRARRFPTACIASPHHLASAAGEEVLASGGNAVDAAVAANLVLGVVSPYFCGPGGDLFAIVADRDGVRRTLASNGRAPAGATVEQVRAAAGADAMPRFGALTVTVPGAVAGWFDLLERHGTRTFAEVAAAAVRLAEDGFVVSDHAATAFGRGAERYPDQREFQRRFAGLAPGDRLAQPDHGRMLRLLGDDGPDAFYRGPIGEDLVGALAAGGSAMTMDDLAAHEVLDVEPMRVGFAGREVLELPPPTQGVTALTALAVVERLGAYGGDLDATHLQIEAVRAALADRGAHVTDPDHMTIDPAALTADGHVAAIAAAIDPERTGDWPVGPAAPGGTAYLCAADADGLSVSLINSHYMGFGSGVVLPTFGVNTQNRGAHFSLDPSAANVVAPRKRTLHTLIPGLTLRDGRPELVFGTMGGDGQPQIHLQVLARLAAGEDLQHAIAAPRWIVHPDTGEVTIESRADDALVEGLRARGHRVRVVGAYEGGMGHAHAIRYDAGGYAGATDPRAEGAVVGR